MSTLQVRLPASQMPKVSPFARVVAFFSAVLDTFAEAQQRASEMQRKYPFTVE
jgi:hypothetical protein